MWVIAILDSGTTKAMKRSKEHAQRDYFAVRAEEVDEDFCFKDLPKWDDCDTNFLSRVGGPAPHGGAGPRGCGATSMCLDSVQVCTTSEFLDHKR